MNGGRLAPLAKPIVAVALAVVSGCASTATSARGPAPASLPSATASAGAFATTYPEAWALLMEYEATQAHLLDALYRGRDQDADQRLDQILDSSMTRSNWPAESGSIRTAMRTISQSVPRLVDVLERAQQLQREVYDIYADPTVTDKAAAVDAAVERYLAGNSATTLPDVPKSMTIVNGQSSSGAFRARFPRMSGVVWSGDWLQLAVYDPLMFYGTSVEQKEGVESTVARFREMLANSAAAPQALPTPPAIAPELVRRHARAAIIFDNLHLLHEVVGDILSSSAISNKEVAMDQALNDFVAPDEFAISEFDWLVQSLRNGIFAQGGPAIGRLTQTERNTVKRPDDVPAEFLPGMGSMGGPAIPSGLSPETGSGVVDHPAH